MALNLKKEIDLRKTFNVFSYLSRQGKKAERILSLIFFGLAVIGLAHALSLYFNFLKKEKISSRISVVPRIEIKKSLLDVVIERVEERKKNFEKAFTKEHSNPF